VNQTFGILRGLTLDRLEPSDRADVMKAFVVAAEIPKDDSLFSDY
jgi:hypothetical protein